MSGYAVDAFPPSSNLETAPVLRALVQVHRRLAEIKGVVRTILNKRSNFSTLILGTVAHRKHGESP